MRKKQSGLRTGISVILSATMVLSMCAVGFTAFAATEGLETPEKIELRILADAKEVNAQGYPTGTLGDDLREAYKGLSAQEKDKISPLATSKIFRLSYNSNGSDGAMAAQALGGYGEKAQQGIDLMKTIKESTKEFSKVHPIHYARDAEKNWKNDGPYIVKKNVKFSDLKFDAVYDESANTKYLAMFESGDFSQAEINGVAPMVTYGLDLSIADQGKFMEEILAKFKAADEYALEIASTFVYGSASNIYGAAGYQSKFLNDFLVAVVNYYKNVNPGNWTEDTLAQTKSDYILEGLGFGSDSTGFKKNLVNAMKTYGSKEFYDAALAYENADRSTEEGRIAAMNAFKAVVAEAYAKAEVPVAYTTFSSLEILVTRQNFYPAILPSPFDASGKALVAAKELWLGGIAEGVKPKYERAVLEPLAKALAKDVLDLELPSKGSVEFNKKIREFEARYAELGSVGSKAFSDVAGSVAKYNAIIKLGVYAPFDSQHEDFTPIKVELDKNTASTILTETLIPNVNNLIGMLVPGATSPEGAVKSLFTNDSITAILKLACPTVYDLLKDLATSSGMGQILGSNVWDLFSLRPANLAGDLKAHNDTEEDKAVAKQVENAVAELSKYKNIEDWATIENLDWGVVPGDYKTFMNALMATLRILTANTGGQNVVVPLLKDLLFTKTTLAPDGTGEDASKKDYSLYELTIIPLFEALGAEKILSAKEYEAKVNASAKTSYEGVLYYNAEDFLRPIMDTLYNEVLVKLMADPTGWIIKNLPNLIYHLDDGCFLKGAQVALDADVPFVSGINVKNILEGFIGTDWSIKGLLAKFNVDLSTLGISYDDIAKIGKLGTAKVVDSVSVYRPSTIKVVADTDSVISYLANVATKLLGSLGIDMNVKGQFVKVEVPAYPHDGKMDKKAINNLINGLEETVGGFVNIEDAINGALVTNEMAGTVIKGIYSAVNNDLLGTVNKTLSAVGIKIEPIAPLRVGKMLGEAKEFKAIAAELKDSPTWADVSFTIKNDDGEVIKQVDMGFKDGDLEGFVKTIVASLRPLVDEIQKTGLLTNKTVDGETVYGLYETLIIPMFEAIGVKPVATSATYTENFNKLHDKDENAGLDYLVNTILKPVLTLLEKFEKNPVATIMEVLPNIAYALKYNPATAFIGNLLLGDKNLADVLGGLISGLAIDAGDNENLAKALTALKEGLKLNPINLDAIISCGEIKEVNSMSALNKTYKTVVGDKADTFVTVLYYLFDTINTGDNLKLIKDLLANIEMDAGLKAIVDGLVNSLFDMTREEALCALGATFSDWTCPNAEVGKGEGSQGTNGKTPGTGDMAISAIAVVSVLFTAGAAIVLLRKKKMAV